MIEKLLGLIDLLGHWSYLIIFLASFLESAAFMGFLVPGETIVVLSGFLASQGYLKLESCISIVALGAVLGDTTGYVVGKAVGRDYFEKHKRLLFLKEKHIAKADEYFRRHGGKTVFFGRFVGFLRAMAPFAAGMSKMPYRRFLIFNASGGITWAAAFTLLGYFFGQSWRLIEKWTGRAGLFIFFIALVAAGLAFLYKKIAGRQAEFNSWFTDKYNAAVSLPYIRNFIKGHPALIAFIKERLSPGSYLGLHLTIGLVFSAVFIWIFGGITEDILNGDPIVAFDLWVLKNVLYFRAPDVTKFMVTFTHLAGEAAIAAGSLIAITYSLFKKRFDYLIAYLTAILGAGVLLLTLKAVVHRIRPISNSPVISVSGWSFPSGHAMMSVVFYGMILYFAVRNISSWKLRVFAAATAVFIVFLLGLSRIYLQVHYISDVLAGYAGGLFWLTVCITAIEVYRRREKSVHPGRTP
jgi:membrane protein DedA with SNARE-associated domain/membrane-associated phospholipid phosphatase